MTKEKVIDRSIFTVGYGGVNNLLGVFLMYINHLFENITITFWEKKIMWVFKGRIKKTLLENLA